MKTHNNNYYYTNEEVALLKERFKKKIFEINAMLRIHNSLISVSFSCARDINTRIMKADTVNPLGVITIPDYLSECIKTYKTLGFVQIYKYSKNYTSYTSLALELSKL